MVERVRNLPREVQIAPVGKSMSPLEAVEHLALTEAINVDFAQKSNPEKLKGKKGKNSFIFRWLMKKMESPQAFFPTGGPIVPKSMPDLDAAAQKWQTTREALKTTLEATADGDACLKHGMFGYLGHEDLIRSLAAHQQYHAYRIPGL